MRWGWMAGFIVAAALGLALAGMVSVVVYIAVAAALLLAFVTWLLHFGLGLWRATPEGGRTWTGIVFMSLPGALAMALIIYAVVRLIGK